MFELRTSRGYLLQATKLNSHLLDQNVPSRWFPYIEAARICVPQDTCHVIAPPFCVTSQRMRKLRGHNENTASVSGDVIEHVQTARTQRKSSSNIFGRGCCGRCLAMDLHVTILISSAISLSIKTVVCTCSGTKQILLLHTVV
jgi:hypothetical protein